VIARQAQKKTNKKTAQYFTNNYIKENKQKTCKHKRKITIKKKTNFRDHNKTKTMQKCL